jgi:CheY-like chemotaxis protein
LSAEPGPIAPNRQTITRNRVCFVTVPHFPKHRWFAVHRGRSVANSRHWRRASTGLFRLAAMRWEARLRHAELVSVRCLLVDDHSTFLDAARGVLDRDGVAVAGTASSIAEALRQAGALSLDVAVVDIGLGDENGFDLAIVLVERGIPVIMTSTSAESDYADLIAESPAAGFLPKAELSAARVRRLLGLPESPVS